MAARSITINIDPAPGNDLPQGRKKFYLWKGLRKGKLP
jgi:hypothetical protein